MKWRPLLIFVCICVCASFLVMAAGVIFMLAH
jgi:hypothetical protein